MTGRFLLATMLAAAAATSPAAAAAAPLESGLEAIGRKVDDTQLGEMRGKFIRPDNISYFGISMQTAWQGPDGITTGATVLFSVGFANGAGNLDGATPSLLLTWSRDGDPDMDVAGFSDGYVAVTIPIGGLDTMRGAVQSQQIAGDDNHVRNDMRIAVLPASALNLEQLGQLQPASNGQTMTFADGDTLRVLMDDNRIGLALTGSGGDTVTQGLDGTVGQAAQHVLLASSENMVRNSMTITIGYNQLEDSSRMQLQTAMTALKGLGF